MNRHRYTLPTSIKNSINNALFTPTLAYCHVIWGATVKQKLQAFLIVQKRALRIMAYVPWYTYAKSYFINFGILKITAFYNYRLACLYKVSFVTLNYHVLKILNFIKRTICYNIRTVNLWEIPAFPTTYCHQSELHKLPIVLNDLLNEDILPEAIFNKSLKYFFFKNECLCER